MLKLYTYILFISFSAVSAQTDVEVTNPFKNSQRSKRWLEGQQPGIGPPTDYNQFVTRIRQAYDPSNYEQTQSKRDLGPFNFIPDYTTPVQNILKNIPGYSWIESNNPGGTYTQIIEGGQNPLRDIFNAVFGPEQTDRILQTGQPNPGQTQPQNFYNNNEYPNRDYENGFNRQQGNDIQIQQSITEVVAENSGNVYNTQYTPYDNNQQQTYSTSQAQFTTNPQYAAPSQPQTSYSQSSAFSSSSQFDGYGTQPSQSNSQQSQTYSPQSQQPNTFNINNPGVQEQTPQTQNQFNSMQYENSFPMSNNPQSNNNVPSQNYRPSNVNVQGNPQFQNPVNMQTNVQTAPQQSSSSILNGQKSVNTPNQVKQKQNPQPEVKYKVLYQTTTPPNLLYTQPPTRPTSPPQKSTGQVNGIPTSQQASRPIPTTSFPAIQSVTDFNPPFTNIKVEQTTRRVPSVPTTRRSKTTTSPYMTRPKLITDNQVVGDQFPPTDNKDKQGVNFKKDALELYGTVIQNVSYAALPNRTAQTAAATDTNKITTPTVQVKTESRFGGYDANSFNQVPTTSKPVKKKCDAPPSPPVPDFREPGRRLSQIKCYEYIWEQQERVSKWNSKRECHRKQNESFYIAGREGMPAEYPHMAAIGWSGSNGAWLFKCAGALVSPRFVLTAAHCSRMPPSDNSVLHAVPQIVRLGDRDVAEKVRTGIISVDVGIKQIITHPEYSPPKQYNDIALVELDKDITFTRHVQPSCLWSNPDTSKLGNQFIATGWGVVDTAFENKPPPPLHTVAVDGLDTNTCNGLIESYCNRNWCGVSENQICGSYRNSTLDACQGDSGAPLQRKIPLSSDSEGSMHYVIGVTSLRIGCGQTDLPAVYTRISSYINWIENIVWLSNN